MHVFEDFLSKEMEKKVRINFRLSYLRDTVLASKVDESLLTTLNTMLYYNSFEIIYYILSEKSKLSPLIETFSQSKVEEKVIFFSEFFTILKLLQGSNDLKFLLNDLIVHSPFLSQSLTVFVTLPSILFRSKLLENVLFLAQYNPDRVLSFFLSKKPEVKSFFLAFREGFLLCEDEGFEIQVSPSIFFFFFIDFNAFSKERAVNSSFVSWTLHMTKKPRFVTLFTRNFCVHCLIILKETRQNQWFGLNISLKS